MSEAVIEWWRRLDEHPNGLVLTRVRADVPVILERLAAAEVARYEAEQSLYACEAALDDQSGATREANEALSASARGAVALDQALRALTGALIRTETDPVPGCAPGHAHKDPPHWDEDGALCDLCLAWAKALDLTSGGPQ